ncbi:MAG: hypothetical protein A3G93_09020 [Nitrospinae bacterium RIFCSPLOWO2_12_FULL_45_22]|nr:MAG: hypothetical protein A3G93_09020 [Nitrospinae bacterium RIFCSPLOWO2_12_FULL_45_22]
MEKRLLLATFLSIAILVLFQYLYGTKRPIKYHDEPEKVSVKPQRLVEEKTISKKEIDKKETDKNIRELTFETKLIRVVLTNPGGRLKAVYLKKYTDEKNQPVNLIRAGGLVDSYPVTFRFADTNITDRANNALYEVSYQTLATTKYQPEGVITFKYTDPEGTKYSKSYIFNHDNYLIKVRLSIENLSEKQRKKTYQVLWGAGLGEVEVNKSSYTHQGPVVYLDKKLIRDQMENVSTPIRHYGQISWVALESKYFVIALISPENLSTAVIDKSRGQGLEVGLEYPIEDSRIEKEFRIYAGPKETQSLNHAHSDLEKIIDFGWFSFLAIPLLQLLNYTYRFTHNYGFSIILLTILIKIVFYPLSHKSYKSMQKMQELQPKIKLIQERYKKDREKLNQEMMALYKQHKANPLGGCLPMLLQIPVFFALYRVLLDAIELRQAPFIWWIKDLSEKDPYYFWPIFMGLTMFIQQKMTPPMGDPRQNRMMLMMPVIFTIMFLNFPVGLVIYWLVNNLLSIMQQYYITKKVSKPRPA